jgi:hypothetical protein
MGIIVWRCPLRAFNSVRAVRASVTAQSDRFAQSVRMTRPCSLSALSNVEMVATANRTIRCVMGKMMRAHNPAAAVAAW